MTSWLTSWLFPDREPEPGPDRRVWIGPCDRPAPEPSDPYNPKTIGDYIRAFALARQLEVGYTDQAAINRDYERLIAAERAADAAAWKQMRADGVPVAQPETETEPEPEADLGHDYDGPELRSGTPEYEAGYAEYQAWADQADADLEAADEWDCADSNAYQARVEAGLEPEAEL
jgi:hypothetical protein